MILELIEIVGERNIEQDEENDTLLEENYYVQSMEENYYVQSMEENYYVQSMEENYYVQSMEENYYVQSMEENYYVQSMEENYYVQSMEEQARNYYNFDVQQIVTIISDEIQLNMEYSKSKVLLLCL